MPTVLGTKLGTMLGTELADMVDPGTLPQLDQTKLYALDGFTAADLFATQVGGGEAGVASGFGAAMWIRIPALGATSRYLFNRGNGSNAGWLPWIDGSNRIQFLCASGTAVMIATPQYQLTASDAGRLMMFVAQHDGTKARLFVNRMQAGDGTAITGYTALAHRSTLSGSPVNAASAPAAGTQQLAWLTFTGTPTQAHILALFDAARAASGDVPTKAAGEAVMPGTTVTHRWSLRDVLLAANVPVADGAAAPATIPDSVTGAPVDAMAKTGSPTVRVLDPATPKLWSYETTPILNGADTLSLANYFECPTSLGDSNTQSFWAAALFVPRSTATSKNRDIFGTIGAGVNAGFAIRSYTLNSSAALVFYDNTGAARNPTLSTIASTDLGKLCLYVTVWDQPALKIRGYWKRAEAGTGFTVTGYAPNVANGMRIGRTFIAADDGAADLSVKGISAGLGVPTLAQVQQLFDDVQSSERIAGIAGMTSLRIDIDADIRANGGAIPTTLVDRQSGTFNFTRAGAPTVAQQYARAWVW